MHKEGVDGPLEPVKKKEKKDLVRISSERPS